MLRHVIIEGPDGAGKTSLVNTLIQEIPGFQLHRRASHSLTGPVIDLGGWTTRDVRTLAAQSPSVYDRHPLISETIYAPVRRVNPGLKKPFDNASWVHSMKCRLADHCLLVVCLPDIDRVMNNVWLSPQMPGVEDNIIKIYQSYLRLSWPGVMMRFDYARYSTPATVDIIRRLVTK